ncbi:TMEM165/GDT1 family protein [Sphingomonas morindae]|uniref:GDT1 family protein n=1 Tax=Sphingomonas morindae TaxID=1541170 RepID=A0ABY4X4J5_9SPHN|nr:TMEM165/GDT1 family protein [Sphingomonas morindae]USI71809.1 TMEM165/GDT1 family protein [Sphingomonas morindae]
MDGLLPAFLLAALTQIGDRPERLVIALGQRYRRTGAALLGVALAAIALMALAGAGGAALAGSINHRGLRLIEGLALLLAAAGGLWRGKPAPPLDGWRLGATATAALSLFVLALGERAQLLVAAIAGASGQPVATAIGGSAGLVLGLAPGAALGARWARLAPLRAIRIGLAALLALAGAGLIVSALELI